MRSHHAENDGASPDEDVLQVIDKLPVFATWSAAEKKRLAAASRIRNHARGKKILACGQACSDLIVVRKGTLVSYRPSLDGRQNVMFYWHRDDILALGPVFGGGPFSFDLHAQSQVSLLYVPAATLLAMIGENPRLVAGLFEVIHARYRLSMEMFCRQIVMPLRERLVDRLIYLAETQGRATESGIRLDIRLSQEDLAAMMSASRQSVNKELRWLVEKSLIALAYNSITVIDFDGLQAIRAPYPTLPIEVAGGRDSPLFKALVGGSGTV